MGPILQHPRLWHVSRRGIALGVALGLFFGLLLPIAQIPMSAGVAVALRANVPAAVASTFSCPACTACETEPRLSIMKSTRPAIRSLVACAPPR